MLGPVGQRLVGPGTSTSIPMTQGRPGRISVMPVAVVWFNSFYRGLIVT